MFVYKHAYLLRSKYAMYAKARVPPQKEPLLEALSVHVAIQRRPEVENCGFWGGLVAEFFFKEILHHFWRGPGQ